MEFGLVLETITDKDRAYLDEIVDTLILILEADVSSIWFVYEDRLQEVSASEDSFEKSHHCREKIQVLAQIYDDEKSINFSHRAFEKYHLFRHNIRKADGLLLGAIFLGFFDEKPNTNKIQPLLRSKAKQINIYFELKESNQLLESLRIYSLRDLANKNFLMDSLSD